MTYSSAVQALFTFCIVVLSGCTLACLIRSILGPSTADRLVAVNMTGTEVICLICLVGARSGQHGFADIALIYAMLSFLSVSVLTRLLSRGGKKK